jgi:hypothetical protein
MTDNIAPITVWAADNDAGRQAPDSDKIGQGWSPGEQPPAEWENERQFTRDTVLNQIGETLNDPDFESPSNDVTPASGGVGQDLFAATRHEERFALVAQKAEVQATFSPTTDPRLNDIRKIMSGNFHAGRAVPLEQSAFMSFGADAVTAITGVFVQYSLTDNSHGRTMILAASETEGQLFKYKAIGKTSVVTVDVEDIGGIDNPTVQTVRSLGTDGQNVYVLFEGNQSPPHYYVQKYRWVTDGSLWAVDASWPSTGLLLQNNGTGGLGRPTIFYDSNTSDLFVLAGWNVCAGLGSRTTRAVYRINANNGTVDNYGGLDVPGTISGLTWTHLCVTASGFAWAYVTSSTDYYLVANTVADLDENSGLSRYAQVPYQQTCHGLYAVGENTVVLVLEDDDTVTERVYRSTDAGDIELIGVYGMAKSTWSQPNIEDESLPS